MFQKLLNSKDQKLVEACQKRLKNLPIYDFIYSLFSPIIDFKNNKLNEKQFENKMLYINTSKLPPDIKFSYDRLIVPLIKICEHDKENSSLSHHAWNIGKSVVKGFLFDFSFITDAMDSYDAEGKMKDTGIEFEHYFNLLVEALQKEQISGRFFNSMFSKAFPSNK